MLRWNIASAALRDEIIKSRARNQSHSADVRPRAALRAARDMQRDARWRQGAGEGGQRKRVVLRWRIRAGASRSAGAGDDREARIAGVSDEVIAGLRENALRRLGVDAGQENRAPWSQAHLSGTMRLRHISKPCEIPRANATEWETKAQKA